MAARPAWKRSFATRLSQVTLTRLDDLVRRGRFKTRTAAIEAAIERLYRAEQEYERKRQALDQACGTLRLGIDRERWKAAELDRLEWEYKKNTGQI
jgi:Arc/MetJ-type ribon-helix-helix transcriptional regulator